VYILIFIPNLILLSFHYIVITFMDDVMANLILKLVFTSYHYMFCTASSLKIFHILLMFHNVDTEIHISYDRRAYLLVYTHVGRLYFRIQNII